MKKILAIIIIFLGVASNSSAQNAIAKAKYQEAEEAFTTNNFTTALQKLNEVEKLLGSSNPKTLFLRIAIQDKQLDEQVFKDLELAANLKTNCRTFLIKNKNVNSLEDKYIEVYNIENKIKIYQVEEKLFADAKAGKVEAMIKLARAYHFVEDYMKELNWYTLAAEKGSGLAMLYVADAYADPKFRQGIQQNATKADEWRKKSDAVISATEKDFMNGFPGYLYYLGNVNKLDILYKAAELGNTTSMLLIGEEGYLYKSYGLTKNYSKAMEWYKKAIEFGNLKAMNQIAELYENGLGVEKNEKIADEYYLKAATFGNSNAMCKVAERVYKPRASIDNAKQALAWYLKAAEKGNTQAMYEIARMYTYGNSAVIENYSTAMDWHLKAGELNGRAAQDVAKIYEVGEITTKNYAKAIEWYTRSYNAGYKIVPCEGIARLYREGGYGITRNEQKAKEWEAKARE